MDLLIVLLPLNLILIGVVAGLLWNRNQALKAVRQRLDTIQQNSCEPMIKALSKFAQGDLSVQLAVLDTPKVRKLLGPYQEINRKIDLLEQTQGMATEEFNNLTSTVSKRLCFVGGDAFSQGKQCGELMGGWLGGKGKVIVSTGHLHSTGQTLRRKGFARVLEDRYPGIQVVGILENEEKTEVAYQQTLDFLKKNPDVRGIYVTEGATPFQVGRAVKDAGLGGKVSVVGQDLSDETIAALQEGTLRATLADSTFAQGHDPIIHLFNHLTAGWVPDAPRLTINADVVTADNWREYWKPGKGPVTSQEFLDRLVKPLAPTKSTKLDLTVIGCENSPYWFPIRDGALMAARELERFGATVHWVVRKGQDLTTEVVAPLLDEARARGTNGIALIAEEPGIIPHINSLVDKKIPIITFITEPSGLRAFITTVTDQSKRLHHLNQGVIKGASIVSDANEHLQGALQATVAQAEAQARQAHESRKSMTYLQDELNRLSEQARASFRSTEATLAAVEDGNQAVQTAIAGIRSLEEIFQGTYKLIGGLTASTEEIDTSIETIKNVAAQVNVLAFNAAVEAARAGRAGAGFKVISEEIRQLSTQAAAGTTQVTERIEAIRQGVKATHALMTEGVEALGKTSRQALQADTTFVKIKEQSFLEKQRSGQVAEHLGTLAAKSESVLEELASMADASGKNVETLKTVEKDGQTLQDQFAKVYAGARELESITEVEQTLLARFVQ